jgi:hypothetical protein
MAFINVGQHGATTKKALKEAVKLDPSTVTFYGTSLLGPQLPSVSFSAARLSEMPEGTKLAVVGPDPYNRRDWYATVEIGRNGVTVK